MMVQMSASLQVLGSVLVARSLVDEFTDVTARGLSGVPQAEDGADFGKGEPRTLGVSDEGQPGPGLGRYSR
jgi:hypothetical protein